MCPDCEKKFSFKFLIVPALLILFAIAGKSFAAQRMKLDEKSKSEVIEVLKASESLHSSFFTYNGTEIEKAIKAVNDAIKKVSNKDVVKKLEESKGILAQIKADRDRKENNKSLYAYSKILSQLLTQYDLGSTYNVYWCPMERKLWIQNSEKMSKVHNPYSPEMPHCGSQQSHY